MKTEAAIRVMVAQAKDHLALPEAGIGNGFSPEPSLRPS